MPTTMRQWSTTCSTWASSYAANASGEWRSLVARLLWEQDAAGSNPVSPTAISAITQTACANPVRKHRVFYWPFARLSLTVLDAQDQPLTLNHVITPLKALLAVTL